MGALRRCLATSSSAAPVVVRFAPSPTGDLHVGGARTALFNYLFYRRAALAGADATFLVRVEDSDAARNVAGAEARIFDDLAWLGVSPTRTATTSARGAVYAAAVDALLERGAAYHDFGGDGDDPGRWRDGDAAEARARLANGEAAAVRFRVPRSGARSPMAVADAVRGRLAWADAAASVREDFVLRRKDGTPLYALCAPADDAAGRVTHVIRADEHVSNTLRQVMVLDALGAPRPTYAHVPLVVDFAGKKLSKRDAADGRGYESTSVRALRDAGCTFSGVKTCL